MNAKRLQIIAWGLSGLVAVLAATAWGQSFGWHFKGLSTYQIFPVFGLLAFSIMWSHYIAAALRLYFKIDREALVRYFEATSLVVLGAILLHPGLLAWQTWRDGMGLPPGSELHYVSPSMGIYVLLGMLSLLVFLVYELRRKFGKKSWWQYVASASDAAMLLILLHSLKLGSNLQVGWFRLVWYFYGLTYVLALAYIYSQKFKPKTPLGPAKSPKL